MASTAATTRRVFPAWPKYALRFTFGGIWLIDAVLKWPGFRAGYAGMISGAGQGQPGWLKPWFSFWTNLQSPHGRPARERPRGRQILLDADDDSQASIPRLGAVVPRQPHLRGHHAGTLSFTAGAPGATVTCAPSPAAPFLPWPGGDGDRACS